ncbi:head GIN domain-containing protein [Flavobacterium sp.]|uniref:head GIN domain-containing protein n=1 Tax=Flavobacterium sp. TaxID=239 RepID=UPI003B98ED68
MNKVFQFITVLLFSVSTVAQKSKTLSLTDFSKIEVFDRITLVLVPANETKAEISGAYQNEVTLVQKNDVLKIRMPLKKLLDGEFTKVILYYKNLSRVEANEGSTVSNTDVLQGQNIDFEAKEGAEIRINTEVEFAKSRATTGGIIVLAGRAAVQEISIGTGGRFEGKDLQTEETTVTITTGGNAQVNASETVNAKVRAGGTIEVYGNPKNLNETRVLGGTIVRK